jgi:hypothetical protein
MADDQESALGRVTEGKKAILVLRMDAIRRTWRPMGHRKRHGFVERHIMLPEVRRRLASVPLKAHRASLAAASCHVRRKVPTRAARPFLQLPPFYSGRYAWQASEQGRRQPQWQCIADAIAVPIEDSVGVCERDSQQTLTPELGVEGQTWSSHWVNLQPPPRFLPISPLDRASSAADFDNPGTTIGFGWNSREPHAFHVLSDDAYVRGRPYACTYMSHPRYVVVASLIARAQCERTSAQ